MVSEINVLKMFVLKVKLKLIMEKYSPKLKIHTQEITHDQVFTHNFSFFSAAVFSFDSP